MYDQEAIFTPMSYWNDLHSRVPRAHVVCACWVANKNKAEPRLSLKAYQIRLGDHNQEELIEATLYYVQTYPHKIYLQHPGVIHHRRLPFSVAYDWCIVTPGPFSLQHLPPVWAWTSEQRDRLMLSSMTWHCTGACVASDVVSRLAVQIDEIVSEQSNDQALCHG